MAAGFRKAKLTQTAADRALPEASRYVIADTEIAGFWLVVSPTGRKSFMLRYRVGGGRSARQREPKIGEWPAMKAERARAIALDWSAQVRLGGDPSAQRKALREAPTMQTLLDRFLTDHARATKKASSVAEDESLLKHYLLPAFAHRKIAELSRSDVDKFHKTLASKPYRANRAVALLSKAMNLAEVWGWRADGSNPCRHIAKFPERRRERWLTTNELAVLGSVLRTAEIDGAVTLRPREGVRPDSERVPISTFAVAAIRLLVLTGARKGEILGLQWAWIDKANRRANLPDSKTGAKSIVLPPPALAVLEALPRIERNPHVIVGGRPEAALVNLKDPWAAIREAAGLDGVRIHDLRHSFASIGAAAGMSLPVIGALLGHTQPNTTARYAHLSDDPLQLAAADIGGRIASAMDAAGPGVVAPFPKEL